MAVVKSAAKGVAPGAPVLLFVQLAGKERSALLEVLSVYQVIGVPLGTGILKVAVAVNEPLVNNTVAYGLLT